MQAFCLNALLGVSVICLIPPLTWVGIGGLLAYGIISITFSSGTGGEEEMSAAIQSGNQWAGCLWLGVVFIVVILGGSAALGVFAEVARLGR